MTAKKGQTFNRYSEEIKKEAVHLEINTLGINKQVNYDGI